MGRYVSGLSGRNAVGSRCSDRDTLTWVVAEPQHRIGIHRLRTLRDNTDTWRQVSKDWKLAWSGPSTAVPSYESHSAYLTLKPEPVRRSVSSRLLARPLSQFALGRFERPCGGLAWIRG